MPHNLPLCPLTVDDSFGPWAGDCRGGFDFTLLFEESILTIPLLCIFILVLPFRMVQLVRTEKKVVSSPLRLYKMVRRPFQPILHSPNTTHMLILYPLFSNPQ